eukprot:scaffold100_cov154-Alexandrium_tamarense.AAC.1
MRKIPLVSERCQRAHWVWHDELFLFSRSMLRLLPKLKYRRRYQLPSVGARSPLGESLYHHILSVHQTHFTTRMARTQKTAGHADDEAKQADDVEVDVENSVSEDKDADAVA